MAKQDDEHIGGREYGAIRWAFKGNEDAARKLVGLGRTLLGNLKNRMRLGEIKTLMDMVRLDDGSTIRFGSNRIGLADMDSVEIYVPPGGGRNRCIGYIVQGFTENFFYSVQFDLTTPSGKRLPYTFDPSYGSTLAADQSPPGVDVNAPYVDNGAKYLDYYKAGVLTDYQEVLVSFNYYGSTYDNRGPNVYSVAPVGDGASSPLFVGDGALTYVWDTSLITNVYPENSYNSITYDIPAHEYSDTNPDTAWNLLGISFTDWANHMANYINENFWGPLIIPRMNAIATATYEAALATQDTTFGYDYRWLFADGSGGTFQRRRDSKGFVTNMGFEMVRNDPDFAAIGGSGVVFHDTGQSYGEGALFMMPYSAERRNLKLSQAVKDYQIALNDSNVFEYITGDVTTEVGGLAPGIPASTFYAWSYADNAPGPNIVQTANSFWTPADTFAIPIEVEFGIHKIKVKRQSTNAQIKKLRIYLLLEGAQSGLMHREIPQDKIVLGTADTEWSKEIHIKIGEFNRVDEVISIVDIAP